MIKCIIDSREYKLRELLEEKGIEFQVEMLELGDIHFYDDNYRLIIERKTFQDLQSSIRDSRFREQRSRLLLWRNEENQKFLYFIEGEDKENEFFIEKRTVERLMIGYQIPILFMKSLEETRDKIIDWIHLENLEKLFQVRSIELDQVESRLSYKIKKNYENEKLFFMEILSHIKGISPSISLAIGNEFLSLKHFILSYEENKEKWESQLKSLEYETVKKNKKKISSTVIEKLKFHIGL